MWRYFHKKKKSDIFSSDKFKDEDFDFRLIAYYFKHQDHTADFQTVDKRVMNDINFDDLFMFIDRTRSKIGQQYLYNKLLSLEKEINFDEQESIINHINDDEDKKHFTQSLLSKINTKNAYCISELIFDSYIPRPKRFWLFKVLSFSGITILLLTVFVHSIFILLLILIYLVNIVIVFWNKKNIMVYTDSIPQLPLMSRIAGKFIKIGFLPDCKQKVSQSIDSINELKNRIILFKKNMSTVSDFGAILMFLWESVNILLLIEPLTVFTVLKKLEKKRKDIQIIFEYIGKIDSAISVASLRTGVPYFCKPVLTSQGNALEFEKMYHLLISDCVSNSLKTNGKSVLLTGSNMSGKTTFIRTVALNVLTALTINTCFAESFALPGKIRLFSAINISDDLLENKSYYMEEVLIIKEMIAESRSESNNLFLLDEIFKGTNTVERIAAGKSVLSYLAKSNIVFVSTHDIELADLLYNEYDLYHFTELIQNSQIHFDYKLKPGNIYTKNAIRILEINGFPKEVIDEAGQLSNSLSK